MVKAHLAHIKFFKECSSLDPAIKVPQGLSRTVALHSLKQSLKEAHIDNYLNSESSHLKSIHSSFFNHLDQVLSLGIHSFEKKPNKRKPQVSFKGFDATNDKILKKLHESLYAVTLKTKQLLEVDTHSPAKDFSSEDNQIKSLDHLLNFIMNRESAKPWFGYYKLLLDKGMVINQEKSGKHLEFNLSINPLAINGLNDVTEFSQKPKSMDEFLDFLKLLKLETLEKINNQYPFRYLMKIANTRSFKDISDEYIQKFKDAIPKLDVESQTKLFQNLLKTTVHLEILESQEPRKAEPVIRLFTQTLRHASAESFIKSIKNNDLGNLLNNANSLELAQLQKKLYELAITAKSLSYKEFQEYTDTLKNLLKSTNNKNDLKPVIEKVLNPKDDNSLTEEEKISLTLIKELNDIFSTETLNSSNKKLFRVLDLDTISRDESATTDLVSGPVKISQQDIKDWLDKIVKNFDINKETAKTAVSSFIEQALTHRDDKASFIAAIVRERNNNDNNNADLNPNLFAVQNLQAAQQLTRAIYADSPPYNHDTNNVNSKYADSMKAAHRISQEGINKSASFWSLAWLARNIPQDLEGQLKTISGDINALGHRSTLEEFAEQLSLKPYQIISSENPKNYPGTGLIINGLKLPQILGFEDVSDNDIEAKNIYKQWINSIERLLSEDPKNTGYLENNYNLSGISQDAEKSRFILTRGFIAITPPDKLQYSIRCSETEYDTRDKYPDYFFSDESFTQKNGETLNFTPDHKTHKTSRWNIVPEHFSLIVFNDHFGPNDAKSELAYLVPTKVLDQALASSLHPDSRQREFSSNDKKYLDFTGAKMDLKYLTQIAKDMKLPILDLTSASNIGSLANAFPKGWKTYHDWENDLDKRSPHESKDRIKAHYHKTHYRGKGYEQDMKPYMHLIYPLQEAENNIDHVASSLQGIHKIFELSLNSFMNGRSFIEAEKLGIKSLYRDDSEPNAHYMLNKAYKINAALSARRKDKADYPLLVRQDDFTRLSNLPLKYPHLDTYDMTLHRLDETGLVQKSKLNADPNNPDTVNLFLENFMNNINHDKTVDIFKGVHFMPRSILLTEKTRSFTNRDYTSIIASDP